MAVKPRPDGYHSVTPYLCVPRVKELIAFLKRAFGAVENAGVKDVSGNVWWIAKHVEDVPPEELERRQAAQKR